MIQMNFALGRAVILVVVLAFFGMGCAPPGPGGGDGEGEGGLNRPCDLSNPCVAGSLCSGFVDEQSVCVTAIVLRGAVLDIFEESPIQGALVQAIDVNGTAVGTTAASDANGRYEITVPEFQDVDGTLVAGVYTLRVQAAEYEEFPTAIRPALPISVTEAVESPYTTLSEGEGEGEGQGEGQGEVEGDGEREVPETIFLVENALTTLVLVRLPGDTSLLGSITGMIADEPKAGILVVAEGDVSTFKGFSDSNGDFTIFNVPAGDYVVNGFALDVQITPEIVTVEEGMQTTDLVLNASGNALNSVSGSVQFVNASCATTTSVILVLESTFDAVSGRGAAPPGLRVGEVEGAFSISGIPDGLYAVLAAFENDCLVRDPDLSISGTDVVFIELPDPVQGNDLVFSTGFKVTEALGVIRPGADGPEEITDPNPVFEWVDDSGEQSYDIIVVDSFGNLIWETSIDGVSGSATVTLTYAGPPLEAGVFYQFKVVSINNAGSPLSTTEDLTGVFFFLGS